MVARANIFKFPHRPTKPKSINYKKIAVDVEFGLFEKNRHGPSTFSHVGASRTPGWGVFCSDGVHNMT